MPTKRKSPIRKAIVTGGAKGFGVGIAQSLIDAGYRVWITGRDSRALDRIAKKIGATPFQADVSSPKDWDKLIAEVKRAPGKFEVLVNNAGAGVKIAPAAKQSDAEIDTSIAINLTGAIYGCRRVAPLIVKAGGGTIVNISSACAHHAWPGWSTYSAAKAGLEQFSKCLYLEHREQGLRVTSIAPSWGATSFSEAADLGKQDKEIRKRSIKSRELGKVVADVCALPSHLFMQEVILWPSVQPVEAL